jgi:hypothetical protein
VCAFSAPISVAETYEYTVSLDDELSRATVRARFPGGVSRVSARHRGADAYLLDAADCDSGKPLASSRRSLQIDGTLSCLTYSVDLRAANTSGGSANPRADFLLLPVDSWLWRPRLGGADVVIVAFELGTGMAVSVPWEPVADTANTFRLTASPQSGTGLSLFGRLEERTFGIAGADLRIAVVPRTGFEIQPDLLNWTRKTAEHVTLAYGRFPNPTPRVLLFPTTNPRSDSAIPFGRVVRDGGETIELLVDPRAPEDRFVSDWTATHEFAHLMLPYIKRDERWISEGFAGYYQNVLLARAGRYSEQEAWQKLADGLERGRGSVPSLSPNQAASEGEQGSRMKIYWSGAALFLMADVELRRRSGGAVSLDTVLDRFQACCLPSSRAWTGQELFAMFDSLVDEPVFLDLYRQHANTAGFPPFRPLLDQLGARVDSGKLALDDNAELADIRAAITEQRYTDLPDD